MDINGLQVLDAVPLDDGSLTTSLVDPSGQIVGTVTRLPDGSAQTSLSPIESDTGFNWADVVGKVTQFLDNVANAAQQASDEAARVSHAIQGGVAGATTGYKAPVNLKPWIIGGAVVVGALILARAAGSARGGR